MQWFVEKLLNFYYKATSYQSLLQLMSAHQSLTVLKMPLVLTLPMDLSVSVHLTSLEMAESVELDAMVSPYKQ